MTKSNKASTARETVYDRCAYVGCYNGKYINGRRLFHFPAETDRRLEMWIERSGNFRLRTWAGTSLRKAGICGDHFDEKSFTNATRKALRRNVVPRHYTEDLKRQKANREIIVEARDTNDIENENETLKKVARASSTVGKYVPEEGILRENIYEESLLYTTTTRTRTTTTTATTTTSTSTSTSCERPTIEDETIINKSPRQRSASPVVEFIVEELDESLISQETPLSIVPMTQEDDDYGAEKKYNDAANEQTSVMTISLEVREREKESSNLLIRSLEESNRTRIDSTWKEKGRIEEKKKKKKKKDGEMEILAGEEGASRNEIVAATAVAASSSHVRTIKKLRNENKRLRNSVRMLRQNLRRAKAREANLTRMRETLGNIDEFLNVQDCENPMARAMVKLALHRPKAPYNREERDFSTMLYRDSSLIFGKLRKSGCNLPDDRTMKRWLTEKNNCDSLIRDLTDMRENDDLVDETDARLSEKNYNAVEPNENNDVEMIYMPVTIECIEDTVVSTEVSD